MAGIGGRNSFVHGPERTRQTNLRCGKRHNYQGKNDLVVVLGWLVVLVVAFVVLGAVAVERNQLVVSVVRKALPVVGSLKENRLVFVAFAVLERNQLAVAAAMEKTRPVVASSEENRLVVGAVEMKR